MSSDDKLLAIFVVALLFGGFGSVAAGIWGPVCGALSCVCIAFSPNKEGRK